MNIALENIIIQSLSELDQDDLASVEELLQTGSDQDWQIAIEFNDFQLVKSMIETLIARGSGGGDISLVCRCIGLASNIHPSLWRKYVTLHKEIDILRATSVLTSITEAAALRFNIDIEGSDLNLKLYLLVLFQMYAFELIELGRRIQDERIERTEGISVEDVFIDATRRLLSSTLPIGEEYYFDALKCVAAINCQFPSLVTLRDLSSASAATLSGKPNELSSFLLSMQIDEGIQLNITEALLHLLNDLGYPRHNSLETGMYIRLFCDLYAINATKGYFYVNDSKVLLDIILREISNIADEDYIIKHKYLVLLGRLFAAKYFEYSYRVDDFRAVLSTIVSESSKVLLKQKASQLLSFLSSEGA
jgi:hypothetical protein